MKPARQGSKFEIMFKRQTVVEVSGNKFDVAEGVSAGSVDGAREVTLDKLEEFPEYEGVW